MKAEDSGMERTRGQSMVAAAICGLALLFVSGCQEASISQYSPGQDRMTDGMVLDVNSAGDVRIGARGTLIVTANGRVFIDGPFTVGDALNVEDGRVQIRKLEQSLNDQNQLLKE